MLKSKLMQLFKDNAKAGQGVRAEASDNEATIYLYDAIGDWYGVSAKDFCKELAGIDAETVHLRINSPGGDVFEARAMATAIKQCGKSVVAHIDGVCASAATYVALAAASVEMADGSFFMIHKAWALSVGNSDDLRDLAALLDKVDDSIVADYVAKTGKCADEIMEMMTAETWMTAQEALSFGFVDSVFDGKVEDSARWDLSAYEKTPAALIKQQDEPVYDRDRFEKRLFLVENARG
jgi:ATP-dependent protease ClpP protease subunit